MPRKNRSAPEAAAPKAEKPLRVVPVASPEPAVVAGTKGETETLRLRGFLDLVSKRCEGIKKADLKTVVEATLAEMGAALGRQDVLQLPPLGKLKVQRVKGEGDAAVRMIKLQSAVAKKAQGKPLAADED